MEYILEIDTHGVIDTLYITEVSDTHESGLGRRRAVSNVLWKTEILLLGLPPATLINI